MRELDIVSEPSCLLCGLGMNGVESHGSNEMVEDEVNLMIVVI